MIFHQGCKEMLRSLEAAEEITQVTESLHISERTQRRHLEANPFLIGNFLFLKKFNIKIQF
ncbi:MAG: hypothetical protein ACI89D_000003 [Bermanella sp.]